VGPIARDSGAALAFAPFGLGAAVVAAAAAYLAGSGAVEISLLSLLLALILSAGL